MNVTKELNKSHLDTTESSYVRSVDRALSTMEDMLNARVDNFYAKVEDIKNYYYKLYSLLDDIKERYSDRESLVAQATVLQNAINKSNDSLQSIADCYSDCDCDCDCAWDCDDCAHDCF